MNNFEIFFKNMSQFFYDMARLIAIQLQPIELGKELQENGWYPIRLISRIEKDKNESIDSYMERVITGEDYIQIKEEYCYGLYPERKHILMEAFELFEKEKYIACIPLFLTQIDGIARDFGVQGAFHGKKEDQIEEKHKKEVYSFVPYVIKNIESDKPENIQLMKYLYSPSFIERGGYETMLITRDTRWTSPEKNNCLNRSGILHGFKEYLCYGNRPNALRVINFLIYVINLVEDLKLNNLEQ